MWTQADIDKLKTIIASGVESAHYDHRGVRYQGLEQLRALLASMEQEVAGAAGRPSYRRVVTRKGFSS